MTADGSKRGASAPRIAFLGAGSIQFAPSLVVDLLRQPDLPRATLAMMDIDEAALETTFGLARRLRDAARSDVRLERTPDLAEAVAGADAVIVSVEIDRFSTWERDRAIPEALGVAQALGENGGPGGLLHALRQIPPIVDICRDVARLAPSAFVINLSNPLSRICQAIADATEVRWVGLCHEIKGGNRYLARVLETDETDLAVTAAGTNHFTWYLDIRDRRTGGDLYPAVRAAAPRHVTHERLLVSELLRLTGWLCVTNDSHAGEYLAGGHLWRCAWAPDLAPLDFYAWYRGYIEERAGEIRSLADGQGDVPAFLAHGSGEDVMDIVADAWLGRDATYDAVNVRNDGLLVEGLPPHAVVEVPGRAAGGRIEGRPVGALPMPIAEWCRRQVEIHRLTARAALEGSRDLALQALLIDPTLPDASTAGRVLDALLDAHRTHLPRFHA